MKDLFSFLFHPAGIASAGLTASGTATAASFTLFLSAVHRNNDCDDGANQGENQKNIGKCHKSPPVISG